MSIKVAFTFVLMGVVAVFAGGSVLMALISTLTKSFNDAISNAAGGFASWFGFAAILCIALPLLFRAMMER